jgi:hypothetical protein
MKMKIKMTSETQNALVEFHVWVNMMGEVAGKNGAWTA